MNQLSSGLCWFTPGNSRNVTKHISSQAVEKLDLQMTATITKVEDETDLGCGNFQQIMMVIYGIMEYLWNIYGISMEYVQLLVFNRHSALGQNLIVL